MGGNCSSYWYINKLIAYSVTIQKKIFLPSILDLTTNSNLIRIRYTWGHNSSAVIHIAYIPAWYNYGKIKKCM